MLNLSRGRTGRLFWVSFLAILAILTVPGMAVAENSHILIVAIQIAGENASDDFIKLYNPSDQDIFLGNYGGSYLRLVKRSQSSGKDYSIKSWSKDATAKIPAKGYFLWASSKNASFPVSIKADSQTSQTLSQNNGVALRTGPENTGQIIDSVGWGEFNNILFEAASFNTNPEAGQVLLRKENNGAYQDTNNNQNDFYIKGEQEYIIPDFEDHQSNEPEIVTQITPPESAENISGNIFYPDNVVFSEILPSPEGPDDKEEWIELFNKNNFDVNLAGWKIKDKSGASKSYIFPENSVVFAGQYLVVKRPDSKITLNNEGDGLELLQPDGSLADQVSFEKSPNNESFNLTASGWLWSDTLTPGKENIIQTISNAKNNTEKELTDLATEKSLAYAKQPFQNMNKFPAAIFLIALSLAIISSAGILFLKQKISNRT